MKNFTTSAGLLSKVFEMRMRRGRSCTDIADDLGITGCQYNKCINAIEMEFEKSMKQRRKRENPNRSSLFSNMTGGKS